MSFRKVTPVKKSRKTAATPVAQAATKKKAAKKVTTKRRPVAHKG
ncbi:hypothetical protein ACIBBD_27400 [Streptomyces sp. NPDC051315]